MKKVNRWLSIVMCFCLLFTSLSVDRTAGYAEGEPESILIDTVLTEEAESEILSVLEEDAVQIEEPASEEEEFNFGYAEILQDAELYAGSKDKQSFAVICAGSIVLATKRDVNGAFGRMKITFIYEGAAKEGWVEFDVLTAMSEKKVAEFQNGIEEAICYQNDVNYPLPEPVILLHEMENKADEELGESDFTSNDPSVEVQSVNEGVTLQIVQNLQSADETVEDESVSAVTLALTMNEVEMHVGETIELAPAFSDGKVYAVNYMLSQSGIVDVDPVSGMITAVSSGTVTVQVRCIDLENVSASIIVTVIGDEVQTASQTEISVHAAYAHMIAGEAMQLYCDLPEGEEGEVEYSVSDDSVLVIDENGLVTAVAEGTCVITAALKRDGISVSTAQYTVEVYAIDTLKVSSGLKSEVGKSIALAVDVPNALRERIVYASSDENIARIDSKGVWTGVAPGKAAILLALGDLTAEYEVEVYTQASEFTLSIDKNVMNMGEAAQLSVEFPELTGGNVVFESRNPIVAAVDASTGLVMTVGPGKAELAAIVGDVIRTVTIEVYGSPTSLDMRIQDAMLTAGYYTQVSVALPEYIVAEIRYSSSDESVAIVDENGVVYACAAGYCEIIAEADNGVKASVSFRVIDATVELNTKYHEMAVGQKLSLNYSISDQTLASLSAVYGTSDASVATVDPSTGLVTAVSAGEAIITLTLGETGLTAQCYVTVKREPTRIVITNAVKDIGIKQVTDAIGYALYAGDEPTIGSVAFKSSDTKVVQVSAGGEMKGVKAGKATITVSAYNGVTASFNVTVKKAPSKLTLKQSSVSIAVGQMSKIDYTLTSGSAAGMEFTSSNPQVVAVDGAGCVTAVAVGTAKIKVATHNGLNKYLTVTVNRAPENVTLSVDKALVGVGMTASAKGKTDASSGVSFDYEYWTDHPEIVSVNEATGAIEALEVGVANVFVKTYNGVTSHTAEGGRVETSVQIKVVPEPDNVAIDGKDFNIIVGETIKLPVSMTMNDGSTDCMTACKFSTSNAKIAAVNASGQVKGLKAGTATITLTAENGDISTCKVVVMKKPTKVVLSKSAIELGEEGSAVLAVKVYYSSKQYYSHTAEDVLGMGKFVSGNEAVVKVDPATGELAAVAPGSAKIFYKTLNGKSASCNVIVYARPTEIGVNFELLKLGAGMSETLTAVFKDGEMGEVRFSSSHPEFAVVDSTSGKVTAVAEGVAVITVDAGNGVTTSCEVRVVPKPDNVIIEGKEFNVIVGRTIKLPVSMTMNDGSTDCMTTYKLVSSNAKVASVNASGQVKGVKVGTATITLTAGNGDTATCKVVVMKNPSKVVLNKSNITIGEKMSEKISAKVYYSSKSYYTHSVEDALGMGRFTSSDESVVEVDAATGEITAVSRGSAKIAYKTLNGKTASCAVTVYAAPSAIRLNKTEVELGEMMSDTLSVSFNEYEFGDLKFESSNPNVVRVDDSGKITAVSSGEAVITVSTLNDVSAACIVKVLNGPDEVRLNVTSSNMAVKGKIQLKPTAFYRGSTEKCKTTFTYQSSNTKVATVSSDGVVTGVKTGTATIRVQSANGQFADCRIEVRKAPTKAAFQNSLEYVGVGERVNLPVRISYSGGSCLYQPGDTSYAKLSVEDTSIAKVDPATGDIIGIEVGRTYVYLTTYNGKTAKCRIVVAPGPDWISLDSAFMTLSRGEIHMLTCSQSESSVTTISYSSSDPKVVSVSGTGSSCWITAVNQGTAVITATAANGKISSCQVTVMATPEDIAFETDLITIGLNETAELPKVIVSSSQGECSQAVAYSISGTAASMTIPGYVVGVSAGTAVVTAETSNGLSAVCTVSVMSEPTEMTLTPANAILAVGDTTSLRLTMDAAGKYSFSVDDPSVLQVFGRGNVTALKPGTATITATAYNGCSTSCTIKVMAVPGWVRFAEDEVSLNVGSVKKLTAAVQEDTFGKVTYVTSDKNIAVVDESGRITAVAPGTAEIRAYIYGHESVFDTCNVTVLVKPEQIILSSNEMTLRKGSSEQIKAEFIDAEGVECFGVARYDSSNKKVVTVNENGMLTAIGAGEAEIIVSLAFDKNVSAVCKVTVVETSVGFDISTLSMCIGETYDLNVDLPEGNTNFSISSSPAGIVVVDSQTHVIRALREGTTTVKATNNGDIAQCVVTVTKKPDSLTLADVQKRMVIGEEAALNAQLLPEGSAARLTYTTSDSSVATVSDDGIVHAKGYGSAVITVSNYDGSLNAQCTIEAVHAPELIRFGELDDIVITAGDRYILQEPIMYHPDGSCDAAYTLAISDSAVVSLEQENGQYVICALKTGKSTLRLKTNNGKVAVCTVSVVEAPSSMAFEAPVINAAVGEKIMPVVRGSNGAEMSVVFESDDGCVVVEADGSLRAVSEGTAVIAASSRFFPGLKAEARVEVRKIPENITLSAASMTLAVGERDNIVPEFDAGAASANVQFESSDETVVHVGKNGSVVAVGMGTAVVTATAFGGKTASCTVTVKAAPTALSIMPASINACVKDSVQLTAKYASTAEYANLTFESANETVAKVSDDGVVTFLKTGETVIHVRTFNGYTVDVPVVVSETPSRVGFYPASAVILSGDSAKLNIVFDKGAGYCTLTSNDPAVVSVEADGTVRALKAGVATIALEMPGLNLSAKCELTVVDRLEGIELKAEKSTLQLHESTQLTYELAPANAIGTGLVTFSSSNPDVAAVDRRTGLITGVAYGTAVITASTADGCSASYEINVLGGKRRMLVAYYFGETGDSGYLPFAYNNGYSMVSAFSASTVEGQKYDIKGPMSNAPKSELFSTIASHFSAATEDDVSVIYICAHGSGSYGPNQEYAFAIDSTHYVTASELMTVLEKIKGRVVLIMDSCHSGGMIDCNKSRLDAQNGRISVIASSHRNTTSCFWSSNDKFASVDFYTHALLQGVGFNEANGIGGARGWIIGYEPADKMGDGDGKVDLSELFSYAETVTVSNLKKYQGYSQFRGNPAQTPQSYIGSMNEDLVMFAR